MGDMDTDPDSQSTECSLSSRLSPAHLPAFATSETVLMAAHPICELPPYLCSGGVAVPILQTKELCPQKGGLHEESVASLGLSLPFAPPQGHMHFGHLPSSAMCSVLTVSSLGEGQDGSLLPCGCQGTAREVTHSRVTEGHPEWAEGETGGPGHCPRGPSDSPFLSLASLLA